MIAERNKIIVRRGERTCLICGDTFPERARGCIRCAHFDDDGSRTEPTPSVPTVSYLLPGEYEEQ